MLDELVLRVVEINARQKSVDQVIKKGNSVEDLHHWIFKRTRNDAIGCIKTGNGRKRTRKGP